MKAGGEERTQECEPLRPDPPFLSVRKRPVVSPRRRAVDAIDGLNRKPGQTA